MDKLPFQDILDSTNDVVIVTDAYPLEEPDGPKIIFANQAFYELSGYTADEVMGKTPRILQGPKTDRKTLDKIREALEKGERINVELLNYSKRGEEYWLDFSINPIYTEEGELKYFAAIERDITEKKAREEKLKASAFEDPLTSIFNRRHFEQEAKTAMARLLRHQEVFGLMLIDIDNFKDINDNLGHAEGDKALCKLAQICNTLFRECDLVFRYGGDEFVVILHRVDNKNSVIKKGQLLIDTMKNISDKTISISIGATLATEQDTSIETIFNRADRALYDVKKNRKGKVKMI